MRTVRASITVRRTGTTCVRNARVAGPPEFIVSIEQPVLSKPLLTTENLETVLKAEKRNDQPWIKGEPEEKTLT